VLEQTVQLHNVPDADIDTGSLVAGLSAWQAHNYPDDQGQVITEFLDGDGSVLGTIASPLQHVGTGGWVEVTVSGAVPPGARQVRGRVGRAHVHLVEVDRAADALGQLTPGPAAILGRDEAKIPATGGMAARVERRRVGRMRREAHEVLDRRQPFSRAVRRDRIEAVVRGEVEAGGITCIDSDPVKMRVFGKRLNRGARLRMRTRSEECSCREQERAIGRR